MIVTTLETRVVFAGRARVVRLICPVCRGSFRVGAADYARRKRASTALICCCKGCANTLRARNHAAAQVDLARAGGDLIVVRDTEKEVRELASAIDAGGIADVRRQRRGARAARR